MGGVRSGSRTAEAAEIIQNYTGSPLVSVSHRLKREKRGENACKEGFDQVIAFSGGEGGSRLSADG